MNTQKKYIPGTTVSIADIPFIILDDLGPVNGNEKEHDLFVLAKNIQGKSEFGFSNNYAVSTLLENMDFWFRRFISLGVDKQMIRSCFLDLTMEDGSKRYGKLFKQAAPLTLEEYQKYRGIIPATSTAYYLATGYNRGYEKPSPWNDMPNAIVVGDDCRLYPVRCCVVHGIRPAMVVSSRLLDDSAVSNNNFDLSDVPTNELLEELRRRIKEDK